MKRKICFPYRGATIGGSHFSSLLLVDSLDKERYDPVIVLHEEGDFASYLREAGYEYRVLPVKRYVGFGGTLRYILALLSTTPRLVRFLKNGEFDIVHGQDGIINLTWVVPARIAGCRYVWHQRANFRRSRFGRKLVNWANAVVCVSSYIAKDLNFLEAAKVKVVINPYETEWDEGIKTRARRTLLRELGVPENVKLVGFVGNFMPRKRPDTFVKIVAGMNRAARSQCVFVMFGGDRQGFTEVVRSMIQREGLESVVHVMGFRTPAEEVVGALDVLVSPAVDEPYGRTLVEAMLLETGVVAARSGGNPEIIADGETGILVEPDDVQGFARTMERLIENPGELRDIAARAGNEARRRYSISGHANEISTIYEYLLNDKRTTGLRSVRGAV